MIEVVAGILVLLGGLFSLIAALGLLRLPDVLTRMHASTKAGTLSGALILLACAFVFGENAITVRSVITILFLLLTAPIAAHMIGRAATRTGMPIRNVEDAPDLPEHRKV